MTPSIPKSDYRDLATLPEACRKEIREWLRAVNAIMQAPCKEVAIAQWSTLLGVAPSSIYRKLKNYRQSGGDWRAFINHARYPQADDPALPPAFIQLWKRLCEENQRVCKGAHKRLLDMWRTGEPIDGYNHRPEANPRTGIPYGWTYTNLMRYRPTKMELAAMRSGLGDALSQYGAKMLTTRVGLWVGSHYMPDDVTQDFKVALLAHGGQLVRIQELGVLDVYSACRFAVHRRPEYRRPDGKRDRIKEVEMRWLVASILRNTGYSPRGTQWVVEAGTAAIREALELWMQEHVSDKITVRRPGFIGRKQILGEGQGGGNSRHKAPLESVHNPLHNLVGHLPAATGHNHREPERLHKDERYNERLLEQIAKIGPEAAGELRLTTLEYWQACEILDRQNADFNGRTDHDLEGWELCHHTTIEYRLDPRSEEWISKEDALALPDSIQHALALRVNDPQSGRLYYRPRKLSPLEVYSAGARELICPPDHIIALMFVDDRLSGDLRVTRRLNGRGYIKVSDLEVSPDPIPFEGYYVNPDGRHEPLQERRAYGTVLNPYDAGQLWAYNEDGAYLGTIPAQPRLSRLDQRGIEIRLGEINKANAAMLAPLKERHARTKADLAELYEHNRRVLEGKSTDANDIATARKQERATRKAAAIGRAMRESDTGAQSPNEPSVLTEDWTQPTTAQSTQQQETEQW